MSANERLGLNYRRRVIYRALLDTFTDVRDIQTYFDLWQRDHSREAHFVVTRFASVVAKAAGFDAERKSQFQRRLFHGLTMPYESLPLVPGDWLTPTAPPTPANASMPAKAPAASAGPRGPSPRQRVFQAFAQPIVTAVLAKVERQPNLLLQAVEDLGVGLTDEEAVLHWQLRRWASSAFSAENMPTVDAEAGLRTLAHQLYLLAADLIGPMQADRLLAQAVAEAERLPEASRFSPQRLL